MQISKLVQVFSKQAAMIDALISHFTGQLRKKKQDGSSTEQFHDGKLRVMTLKNITFLMSRRMVSNI